MEWLEQEANGNVTKWKIDLTTKKETDGTITKDVQRRVISEKGNVQIALDTALKNTKLIFMKFSMLQCTGMRLNVVDYNFF